MGELVIRNIDDAIIERLKDRAAIQRQPLEQALRNILIEAADSALKKDLWLTQLEQCRALTPAPLSQPSQVVIRALRDES
ncbi:MAG: hypothetical protein HQL60_07960 [Magnetococcales bacterium]|nr:hypothetical protein [Magnetococcales bacterium]